MYAMGHQCGPLVRYGKVFRDEDPVTFMEVEAISWENPPYLSLDHAQWVRTIMHDPMTKRVRVSR